MTPTRRVILGAGLGLVTAAPALADEVVVELARDAAPPASDATAWGAYEARLRARLADGGGARVDRDGAHRAFDLTNTERRRAGSGPLEWHDELALTARAHAADLAQRNYVEHLSPEGFDPSHRFWLLGRTTIGSPSENIAYHRGPGPAAQPSLLLDRWRKSPGHWRNLLRPTHTHAAYALVRRQDRAWLVGLYARPVVALPDPLPFHAQGLDVARALRSVASEYRPRVSIPQGSRPGRVQGAPPVMQLTALRSAGATDIVGGPIFLTTGLG